jgi:DNA-binding IclR family transcriptional regulator
MNDSHVTTPVSRPRVRQRASDTPDPLFATTLVRGLSILEAFGGGEKWLAIGEIAKLCGLPRPTASRLANTLATLGYLRKNETRRYCLAPKVLSVGFPLMVNFPIRQVARPLMKEFAEQVGCAVSMGVAAGCNLTYIETVRSSNQHPHLPEVGFTCPLYSTAIGRAAMALMPDDVLEETHKLVEREQQELFLSKRANVDDGIRDCRAQGYCVQYGEWRSEILGAGAPLLCTPDGEYISINCGIPSYRTTREKLRDEYGPRLFELARSILSQAENVDRNLLPLAQSRGSGRAHRQ